MMVNKDKKLNSHSNAYDIIYIIIHILYKLTNESHIINT